MDDLSQNEFWSGPEEVTLPSCGVRLKACKPTKEFFASVPNRFPPEMREKVELLCISGERGRWSQGELDAVADVLRGVVRESILQGMAADWKEHAPDSITICGEDTQFLIDFVLGPFDLGPEPDEQPRVTVN